MTSGTTREGDAFDRGLAPGILATAATDRAARLMSGLIALSRVSGLARLLVAVAVLGTSSPLSNVYSSANAVPTLVFEMLAAGALSATLLPEFRRRMAGDDGHGAARLATAIVVWGGGALALLVAFLVVTRRSVAGLLLAGIDDISDRAAATSLLATLLVWMAPQLIAYLANTVAVAYLQAQHRFSAAVICPLVNNLVLIGTYVVFWTQRDGAEPSLDLTTGQVTTLAAGTLLGVVLMCAVPVADAVKVGLRMVRPLPVTDPQLRRVARDGVWAAVFLAGGQVVVAATLPITNAHDGHGIVWLVAWQVFLLPHALLAVPAITARFPSMAAAHDAGDGAALASITNAGVRSVVATGLLSGALMWALAKPLGKLLAIGASSEAELLFSTAVRSLGPGVAAFGVLHLMARRCYAEGDTRTPAVVSVVVAAVAVAAMMLAVDHVDVGDRLAVVGWAVSVSNVLGAVLLARRVRSVCLDRALLRRVLVALVAGVVAWMVAIQLEADGPLWNAAVVIVGGLAAIAVYLMLDRLSGGPPTRRLLSSLGAAETQRC